MNSSENLFLDDDGQLKSLRNYSRVENVYLVTLGYKDSEQIITSPKKEGLIDYI
jgi:hypothetical protein